MNGRRGVFLLVSLLVSLPTWSQARAATLSTVAEHGAILLEPAGGSYAAGATVHIIPRPDPGYCFDYWSGAISSQRPVHKITMDADKTVTAHFRAWEAPLGIPAPDFGITESYRMYDDPSRRNPALTYQASAVGGFFTHYVDNTDPAATDTSNPCGSITRPRLTIPRGLPAGSVVEVHGGPYAADPKINGTGSQTQPIFIRGPSAAARPRITATATVGYYGSQDGTYIILENLHFYHVAICAMSNTNHIAVRDSEVEGQLTDLHTAGVAVALASSSLAGAMISHIVVCNNTIHECGDWHASGDPDAHGLAVTHGVDHVWILDNLFYHNSGNGVQINAGSIPLQNTVHHIYLGRNLAYENKQDALWTKNATDVIFSQNCIWDHTPSDSSLGGALGSQYGPERVWFLFNEIFDCSYGIRQSTDQGGGGQGPGTDNYFIGNLIHNVHRQAGEAGGLDVWKKGAAFFFASETALKNIFANTIYNTDSGIQVARRAELHVNGNIFFRVAEQHIFFEYPDSLGEGQSDIAGNLFDSPAQIIWGRTGDSTTYTLTTFMAGHPGKADGSMEADPLFVDPANNNYHLQPASPAIDVEGSSAVQQACDKFYQWYGLDIRRDMAGRTRYQGQGWDLGAYEYGLAPVVDLAVSGVSQNLLTLSWTVPGELGITGTPAGYDVRYAVSALSEANWDAATRAQSEPPAGALGQQQSFTITGLSSGTAYYVGLKVLDSAGHASALSNVVCATTPVGGDQPPVLTPVGDRSVTVGETLTFQVSATDADGDPLTYSATSLPAGASFLAATRTFTWTPTSLQGGQYQVGFQVSDTQVTVSDTITITVGMGANRAPALATIGDQSTNEGAPLAFTLSAVDPDGDPLTFSAAGLPSGASLVNGAFQWTPDYGQAGSYPVTFAVSDGVLTDSEQLVITVVGTADRAAPAAQDFWPAAGAFQVPPNTLIALTISDGGLGVDAGTVTIRVNGQLVYAGAGSLYESAGGECRRTGTAASYRYYYQAAQPFNFEEHVSVTVAAADLAHNAMTPVSYEFVTEMRSFGRNEPLSPGGENTGHAAVATDSQGGLWAVWHAGPAQARDIYVAKRDGRTLSWSAPVRLTDLAADQCCPVIAVGSDDVAYVAWQDNRRGNWGIYVSASRDGTTWGDAVRVTDSNDNHVSPALAIDHASPARVYVAWEEGNSGSRDIGLASSNTGFVSHTVVRVTSDPADQSEPALAVGSDDTVYLAWTDRRNGSADIYGSSSGVSGWANVPFVTGPGNQGSPALAVEPGTSLLHVLWVDDAAGDLDVVHGVSNGLPDSPLAGAVIVDDTTHADQSAPALMAARDHWNNTHVYACWQDNRLTGSTRDTDLYFVDLRPGLGGTNILVGDGGTNSNQSDPAVGVDGESHPVVLWADSRGGTPRIYGACSTYFKPVPLASTVITRAAGGRVGGDPASIRGAGDISIQIPAGACDTDMTISISEIQNLPDFAVSGVAGYEIGPSGVRFSLPATVTIPYTDAGTGQTMPYWYDTLTATLSQQGMTEISNRRLANGVSVISFKTNHLTSFYILESPLPATAAGGGGCALSREPQGDIAGFLLPYVALTLLLLAGKWRSRRAVRGC